jgi:CopG family nickel-responsive transcriptional regulator
MTVKEIRETVTFSCDPRFKKLLSKKKKEFGYQTKSQMIRDALRVFFDSENMLERISDADMIVTLISVIYDHHDSTTLEEYLRIQHQSNVTFSSHFHLPSGDCFEILMMRDQAKYVKKLIQELRSIKGLKNISFKLNLI